MVPVAAPYAYARPLGLPVAAPVAAYARPLGVPVAAAYAHPTVARVAPVDDYDPNPQYSYAYDIQDALTGMLKRCCVFNSLKAGTRWLYQAAYIARKVIARPKIHINRPDTVGRFMFCLCLCLCSQNRLCEKNFLYITLK